MLERLAVQLELSGLDSVEYVYVECTFFFGKSIHVHLYRLLYCRSCELCCLVAKQSTAYYTAA
jgi:hypothetical protein|uniref:Uncharacterized protein n=1 Tax=Zea mays TaxID=4577 RepID=B4FD54_MAIZE|nr:unknown [Zea mays]